MLVENDFANKSEYHAQSVYKDYFSADTADSFVSSLNINPEERSFSDDSFKYIFYCKTESGSVFVALQISR